MAGFSIRIALGFALVSLAPAATAGAFARGQSIEQTNADIAAWCAQNLPTILSIEAWAKANGRNGSAVPTPPEGYPPCASCDQASDTPTNPQVEQWIKDSLNPEADDFATISQLAHYAMVRLNVEGLTTANSRCLTNAVALNVETGNNLMLSLDAKTQKMADRYTREPKRAYAGVRFMEKSAKAYETNFCAETAVVSTSYTNYLVCTGNGGAQTSQDAEITWIHSLVDKVEQDVLQGHEYNLCPVYWGLSESLRSLGAQEVPTDDLARVERELEDALHFVLNLNFTATGSASGGSFNVNLKGSANVHFDLDRDKACFTPVVDGGVVKMQVANYTLTETQLVSPMSFDLPVDRLIVTMCDTVSQPLFILHFSGYPPAEQVMAHGRPATTELIQGTFGMALSEPVLATVGKNAKDSTVDTSGTRGAPSGGAASSADDLKKLQATMAAHKGDPGWFLSSEGQAVIKQIQGAAMTKVYGPAINTELANTKGAIGNPSTSLRVNWSNGSATPVDASLDAKITTKEGAVGTSTLKITLTQQSK